MAVLGTRCIPCDELIALSFENREAFYKATEVAARLQEPVGHYVLIVRKVDQPHYAELAPREFMVIDGSRLPSEELRQLRGRTR